MIRFFQRNQIDEERWNRVIASSEFEMAYPYTWYLDACADSWGAFILDDYSCIMPVAHRRKIGLNYSYLPRFCQQLGVFSEVPADTELVGEFVGSLVKKYRFGDYALNEGNRAISRKDIECKESVNYVLNLSSSIQTLRSRYSENCRRNLLKSGRGEIGLTSAVSVEEAVSMKRTLDQRKHDDAHYRSLVNMFRQLQEQGKAEIIGINSGKKLCAAAIFVSSERRIHYLLSFSTEEGKAKRAMFRVLDFVVEKHAGEDRLLDFEGSGIRSVARFFEGFGGKARRYQRIGIRTPQARILGKVKNVRII